jgi:hypothetical protein
MTVTYIAYLFYSISLHYLVHILINNIIITSLSQTVNLVPKHPNNVV